MPKIIVHAPAAAFDAAARKALAGALTTFVLDCERLPLSPLVKSTAWTYFNLYEADTVFMGDGPAYLDIVSVQVFVIEGGLDAPAKTRVIGGVTEIFARHLGLSERVPVYVVIHEIAPIDWGTFGNHPDLAALRVSPLDAPAL